ncbi:MAG: glycosyltransferase family 2 protein [Bacteroidales bacterium]|nr:glycosyltransferase family 2 protein [Bacteroidales bacterium]
MENVLIITDEVFFGIIAISVIYAFVFAFFSVLGKKKRYPLAKKQDKFLILVPAYKEDKVILQTVESILEQEYPENKMDVVVISDRMENATNQILSEMPVILMEINPEQSTKAYALNYAINNLTKNSYDIVVILDADNIVGAKYISDINDAFYSGASALQTHRTAKNLDNDMAILDAMSEEINNSIFRKGHVKIGLSSALIGSGMAFEYKWFCENVCKLTSAGEDKELEILLLKEGIFIDFLDYVFVYDEKVKKEAVFYNQRRRWLSSQFSSLYNGLKYVPKALLNLNLDYLDKIFQWVLLPKIVLLGMISIIIIITSIISIELSFKWWALLLLLMTSFMLALPGFLVTAKNISVIKKLPLLFLLMFINLFRTKGTENKFIHTPKG